MAAPPSPPRVSLKPVNGDTHLSAFWVELREIDQRVHHIARDGGTLYKENFKEPLPKLVREIQPMTPGTEVEFIVQHHSGMPTIALRDPRPASPTDIDSVDTEYTTPYSQYRSIADTEATSDNEWS